MNRETTTPKRPKPTGLKIFGLWTGILGEFRELQCKNRKEHTLPVIVSQERGRAVTYATLDIFSPVVSDS